MEEWQEWQIRADQIAHDLDAELGALDRAFFADDEGELDLRSFWPRFRDLKERVRTAPAIRLEPKLDLERRLRSLGAKAYRRQGAALARSSGRKAELMERLTALRSAAERETTPRPLHSVRREIDQLREDFNAGAPLAAADRQAVWAAWREVNEFTWQRLVDLWNQNQTELQALLATAREELDKNHGAAARQQVVRFFEALKSREVRQEALRTLRAEAEAIRREAEESDQRTAAQTVTPRPRTAPALQTWRAGVARNRELSSRLAADLADLEQQLLASDSILQQAMVRGQVVEKKRKLAEVERSTRALELRIEQTEDMPLIPSAG